MGALIQYGEGPYKKRYRHTESVESHVKLETCSEDGGRGWIYTSTSQGTTVIAGHHQKLGNGAGMGQAISLRALGSNQPC